MVRCFHQICLQQINLHQISLRQKSCLNTSAGFVLPLAVTASFLLLLGSASLHTLALQAHSRARISTAARQTADQLRSAAQAFAQQATGPEACLLALSSNRWHQSDPQCIDADSALLQQGFVGEESWSLIDWVSNRSTGLLRLRLGAGARAAFLLVLDPDGPSVLEVGALQPLVREEGASR